jgi:hypothetical protein
MKRLFQIVAVLALSCATAYADYYQDNYYDTIRPNGHKRSDAVAQKDVNDCYRTTGADRSKPDNDAMKQCMAEHGYRFQFVKLIHTAPAHRAKQKKYWIDPDSGLRCHAIKVFGVTGSSCLNF